MDFGARNYDASLGRWMNLDPLADRYTNLSPYAYVANTPNIAIDPDGRLIVFIGGLRFWHGGRDQLYDGRSWEWAKDRPGVYSSDVFDYWSKSKNSFGRKSEIDQMFKDAYGDKKSVYLSGSSNWISSANQRRKEGKRKAQIFHDAQQSGWQKLDDDETIKVVSHSQGGAHAAGFVEQLLTYKNEEGNNLYNVEIIYYLNPHQPGGIKHPDGIEGVQYSVTTDAISSVDPFWLPNGGDTRLQSINGVWNSYFESVFPEGEEGYAFTPRRGGHNVTDGQQNILKILNDFCKNNPGKCNEIKLEEKK